MKKLLLSLLIFLALFDIARADTNTVHYSLDQPSIGSVSWGIQMNSNLATIDTNLWNASSGTVIGVNAPSASGTNIVLTNPIDKIQDLAFTTTGLNVQLPAMNATSSPVVGGSFVIKNVGTPAFGILEADGSTVLVSTLLAGQQVSLTPLSNSTTNGTWSVAGPFISSVGTVFFGTTTTGASPAISGDLSTGFYTPSAGNIAATISGTETWLLNSAGESVSGNVATTEALDFTATAATSPGLTGVHSPKASELAFETTGSDKMTIGADGGITIGSPSGGDLGPGSLNATATIAINGVSVLAGTSIKSITVQTFCTSGCTTTCTSTCTYTPSAGLAYAIIEAVGGGGGSGGLSSGQFGGGGGGSGGYLKAILTAAQIGSSQTITIGSAGSAGTTSPTNGGTGGTTSIGSLLSCSGGSGSTANSANGGGGGTPTVSTGVALIAITGQAGNTGMGASAGGLSGSGGANPLGFGGTGQSTNGTGSSSTAGNASTGYGAGGGGSLIWTGAIGGASGGTGYVEITEYLTQ